MQSPFIDSETPLRHQHAQIAGKPNVTHRCVIDCMRDKIVSPPTLLCPSPVSPLASQLGPAGVAYGASKFHRVRQYVALIRPLCCGKLFGHVVHDIITPLKTGCREIGCLLILRFPPPSPHLTTVVHPYDSLCMRSLTLVMTRDRSESPLTPTQPCIPT